MSNLSQEEIEKRLKGKLNIGESGPTISPKMLKDIKEFFEWIKGRKVLTFKGPVVTIQGTNFLIPFNLEISIKKTEKIIKFADIKDKISFGHNSEDDKLIKNEIRGILPILDREKQKLIFDEWRKYTAFNINLRKEISVQTIFNKKSGIIAFILAIFTTLFLFIFSYVIKFLQSFRINSLYLNIITAAIGGLIILFITFLIFRLFKVIEDDEKVKILYDINEENFKHNLQFILLPENTCLGLILWKKLPDITLHSLTFVKQK